MVERQRQRVEQEMTKMVNEIDQEYLRKLQAEMHRCAARCCENETVSLESVQRCIENCSVKLQESQAYVQRELENLQSRLHRCVMDCNDAVKDKMGPNPSQAEITKFTAMFEDCATKCVDKHIELIPTISQGMRKALAKKVAS